MTTIALIVAGASLFAAALNAIVKKVIDIFSTEHEVSRDYSKTHWYTFS